MTDSTRTAPIHGYNLSDAWARAFLKCFDSPGGVLALGIVSFDIDVGEDYELENDCIRQALNKQLGVSNDIANPSNIETVAGTIFPESIWKRCGGDRQKLFTEYEKMWPLVKKCKNNRWGTYFRRLTAFGKTDDQPKVAQLEKIISFWEKGTRRHSALQASVFDPHQDHRGTPFMGFPCLQQVVFHTKGSNGSDGLEVVAFYANQLLFEKAYGNYLGLCRLGKFMAGEMGLRLTGITCIASHLKISDSRTTKGELSSLAEVLKRETSDEQ